MLLPAHARAGRGLSVAQPDYNWVIQQIALFIFTLVMVLLYNPTATCQMGFPFHKRTADMRDEADPELQVRRCCFGWLLFGHSSAGGCVLVSEAWDVLRLCA